MEMSTFQSKSSEAIVDLGIRPAIFLGLEKLCLKETRSFGLLSHFCTFPDASESAKSYHNDAGKAITAFENHGGYAQLFSSLESIFSLGREVDRLLRIRSFGDAFFQVKNSGKNEFL
jgi:hypothetical protein